MRDAQLAVAHRAVLDHVPEDLYDAVILAEGDRFPFSGSLLRKALGTRASSMQRGGIGSDVSSEPPTTERLPNPYSCTDYDGGQNRHLIQHED
jgi:hypothetical protein